jgi:hypothetical protein
VESCDLYARRNDLILRHSELEVAMIIRFFGDSAARFVASRAVTVVGAAGALSTLLSIPTPGFAAATPCGARAEVLKQLSKKFKEAPVAVGLSSGGQLIEVLTSDSGSTWTIIVSQPNGMSCLVADGESWQQLKTPAKGEAGA